MKSDRKYIGETEKKLTGRHRIRTYRIFISHRWARSYDYRRMVAMLNRAAVRDPTWRWKDLSVPADSPLLSPEEAQFGEEYISAMKHRLDRAHVKLNLTGADWLNGPDGENVYLELVEAQPRYRDSIPIVDVLPLGKDATPFAEGLPSEIVVKWRCDSIVKAIRKHAQPATVGDLVLSKAERAQRKRIIEELRSQSGHAARAAIALGVSPSTLRRLRMRYLIR